jgi:hypothetical protein
MTPEEEIMALREAYAYAEGVFLMKEMNYELEELYKHYPTILRSADYLKLMKSEYVASPDLYCSDGAIIDSSVYYTSGDLIDNYENLSITVNSPATNNFWSV